MVGISAPASMPTRRYSAQIIGQVWPRTEPAALQDAAEAQHTKGASTVQCAQELRGLADSVAATQRGEFVEAFWHKQYEYAYTAMEQADDGYFVMARALLDAAHLVYGLREDLDEIDRQANEEIENLEAALSSNPQALRLERNAVIGLARAAARATSAAACTALEAALAPIASITPKPVGPQPAHSATSDPGVQAAGFGIGKQPLGGGGGRPGPGNMPEGLGMGGQIASHRPGSSEPVGKPDSPTDSAPSTGKPEPANASGRTTDQMAGHRPRGADDSTGVATPAGSPAPVMPAAQAGNGSGSGFSPPSGGSGFKVPSNIGGMGGGGMPGGLGGGGFPQGLPQGGLPGSGAVAPPASATAPSVPADVAKGFNAGLGSAGAPPPAAFAPAAPPPAASAAGASAPAGAPPLSGPAPVAAAAGAPGPAPSSAPVAATPVSAGPGGGMPAAPVGALPPFGSDVPRSAPQAVVSPAAGTPNAAPTSSGATPGSGPVAPLPPGVVGTGVGASAGATAESVRSELPDPLLESAVGILYQLLHDSRMWPDMDWCVGVFSTGSGVETVIHNGDGLGYIPANMFVPRAAQLLLFDETVSKDFRSQWFSWANPAAPMIAHAQALAAVNPAIELVAVAVSTDLGGSAVPARAAGIEHFAEVSRIDLARHPDMQASPHDAEHVHRLETLDRAEYARAAGLSGMPKPGASDAWRTTQSAVQVVLERAGMVRELEVPPVIRHIMEAFGQGVRPRPDLWESLRDGMIRAMGMGYGLRPGFAGVDVDESASAYVRACHDLTRLGELLLLWEHSTCPDAAELAYLYGVIKSTPAV